MRKIFFLLIAVLVIQLHLHAQGYQLTVRLKNYNSGKLFLGNYMGKNTYLTDSADVNASGEAVLKGKQPLLPGIYLIVLPGKQRYIETLIDKQQVFAVSIDTADLIGKTAYKNSADNDLFLEYNKFLASQESLSSGIMEQLKAARTAEDSAKVQPLQRELGKKVQDYRNDFIAKHPSTILATIFRAMKEPEVPKQPVGEDSTFAYRYFKAHYWDDVDLSSARLVRTPILEGKLKKYFTQLVVNYPDSINTDCDALIARTRKDKEVFKYVLWWLTYNYESSPYMGMDAVFVHLVEKYYVPGEAYWLTDEQLNKIVSRAYALAPNLIGQQAAPLELKDTASKPVSLYKTQAKYTVLVFWDPTCGHCKTEIPRLDSAYKASWKSKGVAMIGVKTEGTHEQWLAFIKENKLSGWVHAWDPASTSNYRRLYDVYSTPVIYLLDEKKKIVAKRLAVEQLQDFLEHAETKKTASKVQK
ncbi:MAG TPA: redoxin domain-containing protein [Chitinophaga sp.]|uniref:redoxin domain-containing protein n=1 Tax=Chitinophaga sp. TaxID=1869181 RepID=UPI002C411E72|nr:redoxin domain-containing protein [Chitinophaga sp.]HVI43670.1 redoxin domain-containing protein [Chitinophaga sp.]